MNYPTKKQKELYEYFEHLNESIKPPKKIKQTDAGKAAAALWKDLMFCPSWYTPRDTHKKKAASFHGSYSHSSPKEQNAIVKMHYLNDGAKHRAFLTEYMTQLKKMDVENKPLLFADHGEVDSGFIDTYLASMTDLHFRFILSPESQEVDLRTVSKAFVAKINAMFGYDLMWLGAIHTNTDNRHVHLLINGIDRKGRSVHFPKSFIKETARSLIQDICTSLIGYRSSEDITKSKSNEYTKERYTSLDDAIAAGATKIVDPNYPFVKILRPSSDELRNRCQKLTDMGVALKVTEDLYYLEDNWEEKLKAIGKYNSFLSARENLKFTHKHELTVWSPAISGFDGVVTQIYEKDDEQVWNNSIVIENASTHQAYFVPLSGEPKVKIGQSVRCKNVTAKNGRVYPSFVTLNSYTQEANHAKEQQPAQDSYT